MGFKYLIYKIITKMRLLGFWAEKSHWCIMEVSLNFLTLFLLYKDRKLGKSADSGAKSCFFRHFWHHYRHFLLCLCCFLLYVDVLCLCQYNQDKSWWCVYFFSSSVGLSMPSGWSVCARHTGIRSPPRGHRQTVCWAAIAHSVGNECPNIGLVFG